MGYVTKGPRKPIERNRSFFPVKATINALATNDDWSLDHQIAARIVATSWDEKVETDAYQEIYLTTEDIFRTIPVLVEVLPREERLKPFLHVLIDASDSELLAALETLFTERLNRKSTAQSNEKRNINKGKPTCSK